MSDSPASSPRTKNPALVIGACVAAVALGVWVWDDAIAPDLFPKRFHTVAEGRVYRSGKLTPAAMERVVRQHAIRTVVDLGAYDPGSPGDLRQARTAAALGVDRVRFNLVGDATGNPNYYVEALRIMRDPARWPVLVHCGAGTERTGCVTILYREIEQGWGEARAFAEADDIGHSPTRNPKLRQVLERWRGPIERALREGGAVEGSEPIAPPGWSN
jgi:protein tyrosine/serine phosphatase